MKVKSEDMLLYAVTDRYWLKDDTLENQVDKILASGATFLQLREKNISTEEYIAIAKSIKKIADKYTVPFVIDDNAEVVVASNADGIHIGQNDIGPVECRKIIGDDKIIGVTVNTVEQALKAQADGADYLGVGAAFSTSTKADASNIDHKIIADICSAVDIPVVAIGGINEHNILKLKGLGIDGVAVVSAIFAKDDVGAATSELLKLSKQMTGKE